MGVSAGCPATSVPPPGAAMEAPTDDSMEPAPVSLAGTYRYEGAPPFTLIGTIRFEEDGDDLRVVNTTYDNANDRPLVGVGPRQGNTVRLVLVPENGERNYQAEVTVEFSDDGRTFRVAFSDTNGDDGRLGSYTGTRLDDEP